MTPKWTSLAQSFGGRTWHLQVINKGSGDALDVEVFLKGIVGASTPVARGTRLSFNDSVEIGVSDSVTKGSSPQIVKLPAGAEEIAVKVTWLVPPRNKTKKATFTHSL